jgi:transcription antitermination factor NusG
MKKFVLLTIGFTQPTQAIMEAWNEWFKSIGDNMVDQVGLRNGKEVTKNDIVDLQMDENAITGYIVVNVENMEEALEIARNCPMITSTKVYELISMA